jgi:hypothetical protein
MKDEKKWSGYDLSRQWFDFCFLNPEKVKTNHTALYFFCIEHCNRLGWKDKYGLPTTMAMEALGIKSYNTYKNTLTDLVNWGFIEMVTRSKNQYSANIIALSKNDKALDKALDKAMSKHYTKQSESTIQSIDSIDKPINKEPLNKEQGNLSFLKPLILETANIFDVNEINNFKKFASITHFVETLHKTNRIEYYRTQLTAYKAITASEGWKHNADNFMGTAKESFNDGQWCAKTYKVENLPKKRMTDAESANRLLYALKGDNYAD